MRDSLPVGAHLVTRRKWYSHHGIHVGNGRVVHYAGYCKGLLHRGPVEEVSLDEFARGHGFAVREHPATRFSGREIARRALNRLGENGYALLGNNCEHFCEWCATGRIRSLQVEALLSDPLAFLRRLFAPGRGAGTSAA